MRIKSKVFNILLFALSFVGSIIVLLANLIRSLEIQKFSSNCKFKIRIKKLGKQTNNNNNKNKTQNENEASQYGSN